MVARMRLVATFIGLASGLAGCATGPYGVTVRSARTPACDQPVATLAKSLPYEVDYPVRVVRDAPLEGTSLGPRGELVVPTETMGRYRYLGEIESARAKSYPSQAFASIYWMPPMHETTSAGLRALCWIQAPLRAMTLGVWAVLAPTSWPCFALYGRDDGWHVAELQRAGFAMGANVLLLKDRESELVAGRRRRVTTTGTRALTAYAFIDTWAAPSVVELEDADVDHLSAVATQCWSLDPSVRVVRRASTLTPPPR